VFFSSIIIGSILLKYRCVIEIASKVSVTENSVKNISLSSFSRSKDGVASVERISDAVSSTEEQNMVDEIIDKVNQVYEQRMDKIIANFNVDESVIEKIEASAAKEEEVNYLCCPRKPCIL